MLLFCDYPVSKHFALIGSTWPVPVAARCKGWDCGRLLAKIVGSNPTPEAWMFFCFDRCVLSGRGLGDGLITRPEESYRMCCVVVCDLETSRMRRPWPALGRSATGGGVGVGVSRTSCYCDLRKLFLFVVRSLYPFLVWTLLPTYCRCRSLTFWRRNYFF